MTGAAVLLLAIILFLAVICIMVAVFLNRESIGEDFESAGDLGMGRHWWQIQLVELESGRRIGKAFQSRLILGRTVSAQEPLRLLFVGAQQTISRSQCEFIERKGSLAVHNLSGVNMTLHNGVPLNETHQLNCGDWLDMGGNRYVLERLERVV